MRRKLGFLNFSAAAGWDPTELLRVYLAAACDPSDQVCLSLSRCRAVAAAVQTAAAALQPNAAPGSLGQRGPGLSGRAGRACLPCRCLAAATSCLRSGAAWTRTSRQVGYTAAVSRAC